MIQGEYEIVWRHHPECPCKTAVIESMQVCYCKPTGHTSQDAHKMIEEVLLPECVAQFQSKAHDYRNHDLIGARGQFGDLARKVSKLKLTVWEGEELIYEEAEEIVKDLFGTVMLMLYCLRVGYLK